MDLTIIQVLSQSQTGMKKNQNMKIWYENCEIPSQLKF